MDNKISKSAILIAVSIILGSGIISATIYVSIRSLINLLSVLLV